MVHTFHVLMEKDNVLRYCSACGLTWILVHKINGEFIDYAWQRAHEWDSEHSDTSSIPPCIKEEQSCE